MRSLAVRERLLTKRERSLKWFRRHGYEIVQTSSGTLLGVHLWRLFAQLDVNIVIDVGARLGEYGLWLRRNGYNGWIHSFEPVSDNFAELSRRAARDARWVVHNAALGSEAQYAEINVAARTDFSSFLTPTSYAAKTFGPAPEIAATERVRVQTLDEIFGGLIAPIPDPHVYLKLDTQGWDLEVLRGASGCLPRIGALQTEVSVLAVYEGMPTMSESLDYLSSSGFALSGLFPVSLDEQLRVVEFDCVAVRVETVQSGGDSPSPAWVSPHTTPDALAG
jgi:FkbM family methyltransferase